MIHHICVCHLGRRKEKYSRWQMLPTHIPSLLASVLCPASNNSYLPFAAWRLSRASRASSATYLTDCKSEGISDPQTMAPRTSCTIFQLPRPLVSLFYTDTQNSPSRKRLRLPIAVPAQWFSIYWSLSFSFLSTFFAPQQVPLPPISWSRYSLCACPFYRSGHWSLEIAKHHRPWTQVFLEPLLFAVNALQLRNNRMKSPAVLIINLYCAYSMAGTVIPRLIVIIIL